MLTGLLCGDSVQLGQGYDQVIRKSVFRRYAGSTVVATARPLPRLGDSHSETAALEEDGMRYFLPEQCGRVPTIESVYGPLTEYIRGWLWEMARHRLLSERLSALEYSSAEPLQRLAPALQSLMWEKDNYRPPFGTAGDAAARPLGSLRGLIR